MLAEKGKQLVFRIYACLWQESDQMGITNTHSHLVVITHVELERHQNKSSPRELYFMATCSCRLSCRARATSQRGLL